MKTARLSLHGILNSMNTLIIVEGHDGAGKSSLTSLLRKHFGTKDIAFLRFPSQEPDPSLQGQDLIRFYMDDFKASLDSIGADTIICDRSFVSTLVYQGFCPEGVKPNQDFEKILTEGSALFGAPQLFWIYLYCDPAEAARRIETRGACRDAVDNASNKEAIITGIQKRYNEVFRNHIQRGTIIKIDTTARSPEDSLERFTTLTGF